MQYYTVLSTIFRHFFEKFDNLSSAFRCTYDRLLQLTRWLKLKPNSFPYIRDSPKTLLFETEEVFGSRIFEKS